MKKVRHYEGDCFKFHKEVLSHKYKGITKTEVTKLETKLKDAFSKYEQNFNADTLQQLIPLALSAKQKDALQNMYSYKGAAFKELKRILTTNENGRQFVTCPNCTIDSVGSFDHQVPQTEFPEYSDNPLNLIVCCTTCNSKKNNIWRADGHRTFLNLYIDDLPDVQYLFVDFDFSYGTPMITYVVRNDNGIPDDLYHKIENHYKRLDLCIRFRESSDALIDELEFLISKYKQSFSSECIKQVVIDKAQYWQQCYGYNYWKSILYISCCENEKMFNFLLFGLVFDDAE